jgi:hypothetical protein
VPSKEQSLTSFLCHDFYMIEEARIAHGLSSWFKKGLPLYHANGGHNQSFFKALIFWEKVKVLLRFEN